MAQIFNRIITMKTAENLTALLKSQEQTLRDAVSFAIETAQKAGATAEVGVTKVSGLSVSTRLQEIENTSSPQCSAR